MMKHKLLALAVANLISPMIASVALAQQAPTQPVAPKPADTRPPSDDQGGLQEIVVTAQKRSENLQRVPIAVTAIGSDALKAAAIDTGVGISRLTPNLTVTAGQGFYSPYLRGVGSSYSTLGLE